MIVKAWKGGKYLWPRRVEGIGWRWLGWAAVGSPQKSDSKLLGMVRHIVAGRSTVELRYVNGVTETRPSSGDAEWDEKFYTVARPPLKSQPKPPKVESDGKNVTIKL